MELKDLDLASLKKLLESITGSESEKSIMRSIAAVIVKLRYLIFAAFLLAAVYAGLSLGKVKVNDDLTSFLPAETETRRGLTVMENEFVTYASANIMVSNVTYETAERLAAALAEFDRVSDVAFDDSAAHYTKASALFSISFDGTAADPEVAGSFREMRSMLSDFDCYISSEIGQDLIAEIADQMLWVLILAALVIVTVLLLTSRSYFEVFIFLIVFSFAALLNMGTNFWFGSISSISNSIAVIMQLALAIDYAIIFSHLYQDEALTAASEKEAVTKALARAIVEISASSLTTISGLVALTLMQFKLGYDLGMVLSKGILCSLITVFLLMPGLILLFPRALKKTAHKDLIPDVRPWGRFLMKTRFLFVLLFFIALPFAIYGANAVDYAFSDSSIDELVPSESRTAMHKITDTFDDSTYAAILVPAGHYEYEKAILNEVSALSTVKKAMGLANIEVEPGHVLTDSYTPRMFAELVDVDIEEARLLFQAYGVTHEQYQPIFGDADNYSVPLVDLFLYLFRIMDQGVVTLDAKQAETIGSLRGSLMRGIDQLQGESWNRLILTVTVPVEGAESLALVEELRGIAEKYYGTGNILVVGEITSARDLASTYKSDSLKINLLTISFILIILLFTFRSVAGSLILVFVIQGSIWMNFAFTYLSGLCISFVTNMIVSAIQMGATIDYAIVIMNRYLQWREKLPPRSAMTEAVGESFPTVFTSGSIMTVAALLISARVSDVYIAHIGLAVGRGAFISVVLVLTVLPQLIVLMDKAIRRTTFGAGTAKGGEDK